MYLRAWLTAGVAFIRGKLSRPKQDPGCEQEEDDGWDSDSLKRFFVWKRASYSEAQVVDDQTWADLGLEPLLKKIARQCSPVGRQVLLSQLRLIETDNAMLDQRAALRKTLKSSRSLAPLAQDWGRFLSPRTSIEIFGILAAPPTLGKNSLAECVVLSAGVMAGWLLLLASAKFLLAVVCLHLAAAFYSMRMRPKLEFRADALSQLCRLAAFAEALANSDEAIESGLGQVKQGLPMLKAIQKRLALATLPRSGLNDIADALLEYLRVFYLVDLIQANRAFAIIKSGQPVLISAFEAVGALEVACAASRAFGPEATEPELEPGTLSFDAVKHPLIEGGVANSAQFDKSLLIAGSNMSGKSTFLKTIGINFILARTLKLCVAKAARVPPGYVKTAIHRKDCLEDKESYFWVELKQLQKFLQDAAANGQRMYFLIDEIFRGTNSVESTAAAVAVLAYLAERSVVLVTTHNLALQDMVSRNFRIGHFSGADERGCMHFDYRLKEGKSTGTNALCLLEAAGYPPEVVRHASETAQQIASASKAGERFQRP